MNSLPCPQNDDRRPWLGRIIESISKAHPEWSPIRVQAEAKQRWHRLHDSNKKITSHG